MQGAHGADAAVYIHTWKITHGHRPNICAGQQPCLDSGRASFGSGQSDDSWRGTRFPLPMFLVSL